MSPELKALIDQRIEDALPLGFNPDNTCNWAAMCGLLSGALRVVLADDADDGDRYYARRLLERIEEVRHG